MSTYEDFLRFLAWANKEGFDVAHSVGDGKYICLNPQTADLWKAWKASKYTPSSNVEGKEAARELVRAACLQERQPTEAHQRAYRAAWDELMRRLTPQPVAPKGFALVPLRMNAEIQRVVDQDNWLWEDLLAAAESITPEQYDEIAAQPVAGAVATDETGWLIEHSGEILPGAEQRAQVSWLRVQMKFNGYGAREFGFTHDANEALRFARKEDAEAVLAMHLGASPPDWYSKPFSVTEHMWPAASQAQAAPAPEPSAQAVAYQWATAHSIEMLARSGGLKGPADAWTMLRSAIERAHGIAPKAAQGEPVAHLGLTETQLMRGNASTSAPSTQPLAALFDLAAVLTGPDGKVAIHGSDGDMRIIDNALQTLRTSIINWTKS